MSDTDHSAIRMYFGSVEVLVKCTCNTEEIVTVDCPEEGYSYEELEGAAYTLAKFDERGACQTCADHQRKEEPEDPQMMSYQENKGDQQARDYKAATDW